MSPRRRKPTSAWRKLADRLFVRSKPRRGRASKTSLMNVDFKARVQKQNWQRLAAPLIVVGLAVGLMLTTLRTDIVRMEYDLAAAGAEEQRLLDQQRRLVAEHRNLLDPGRLQVIARQRGFVRPARVIDIEDESAVAVAARTTRP